MEERLALWGGVECTLNRVGDQVFSQLERNGHATRATDLKRFASLGIRALRYPALWERTAPAGIEHAQWWWLDARLPELRDLGVQPIAGLLHHGSGPLPGGLLDADFARGLARYAGVLAQRYPWLEYYTPVNEPNTTARFSGLYGVWHPHGRDDRTYLQVLINQCKATVYAMREVRKVNPEAKLVQTDDLGKTEGSPAMRKLVEFYNERRWLTWDLLCGTVVPGHSLWKYFIDAGIPSDEVLWFADNPCPPDIIGLNYYITSARWLDDRLDKYPCAYHCEWHGYRLADIEAARALAVPPSGIKTLIDEAWQRYHRTIAVTEAHTDSTRQDQMRWLHEIWTDANDAREQGVDVRAVTVWALLGSYDWNCLVTDERGYYEVGAFDVRAAEPRETAIGRLMRDLAAGRPAMHPALHGTGWWRRPGRFFCEPVQHDAHGTASRPRPVQIATRAAAPIVIIGNGALSRAFAQICEQRDLKHRAVRLDDIALTDGEAVQQLIRRESAWAVVNATDAIDVDEAERCAEHHLWGTMIGTTRLARACAARQAQYLTFSSHFVFDGLRAQPYCETDGAAPLNRYGSSMAETERRVLCVCPQALVVRTGALFGPWDNDNLLFRALDALSRDLPFIAEADVTVSLTYVPDLVHACLDFLIDAETGILHLSNLGAVTRASVALQAAAIAHMNAALVQARPVKDMNHGAARPAYSVLRSHRGAILPTLDSALLRYVEHWRNR
ncbi:family 1 glycosylhydrolase [Paraburkholderia sp. DGU8]|uniref:family 1 glycosylhydrolase n=1 Tax=Paraburkholderia sp. DGU8 TaxID=3161997 RepID=UPI0034657B2F